MQTAHRSLRWLFSLALAVGLVGAATAQQPAAAAPQKAVVSDILIEGNYLVSSDVIRTQLRTRIGQEYVPETLQEDVRSLFATRQYANVWADRLYDGPGKIKVVIHIRDHASVVKEVQYNGNIHLSRDDLDVITGVRKGMPCNPYANKVACNNIVKRYSEEGRPMTSCKLRKGGEPGDTEVIFDITEGYIVRISAIDFTGSTFVSAAVLRQRIQSGAMLLHIPISGMYNPTLLEHDTSELIKYYRNFGYHDVRISREMNYSSDGRTVRVVFHVREGDRYKVDGAPRIEGVKKFPVEPLQALVTQKGGEYYDQAKIDKDKNRIQNYIGWDGIKVNVMAEPVLVPGKPGVVRVNYLVVEEGPAKVGQIMILGNERTKQEVILRQLQLYPGQPLTYPELKAAELRLARLGIFEQSPDRSVKPTVTVVSDPFNPTEFKTVRVDVQETSTGSLMFGVGVNSDAGFTGSIVLNERNFDVLRWPTSLEDAISGNAWRGAGQEFRVEAVPGTQVQRYSVSLREPFLLDSPYSLTNSAYFFQRYYNEYNEDRIGGRVTLGRKIDQYWSAAATVRVEDVRVSNVQPWAPEDYQSVVGWNFQTGVRLGVTHDTRDSVLRPTEGHLAEISYEQVFGDKVFGLANFDFSQYWTVIQRADGGGRHVLSFHNQIGWASDNTPVYERYFGGGFRSIRGFQFRGVGPEENGSKIGGDFLFMNSLEYQMPIRASDQVFLVGFVDSGTVSPNISNWQEYRVSAGVGVRFTVPMLGPVPIALDFGFPIVKGPHDNTQVFNFFMGFTR
jgi:outer membrane protein assembly complex protein YaeT